MARIEEIKELITKRKKDLERIKELKIEEIQELITKRQKDLERIKELKEELLELKHNYYDFWTKFRSDCHAEGNHIIRRPSNICPYCFGIINRRDFSILNDDHVAKLLNICSSSECDAFFKSDKTDWPLARILALKTAESKCKDFFSKKQSLELEIQYLEYEEKEILALLENIWDITDKALGKDVERDRFSRDWHYNSRASAADCGYRDRYYRD